MSHVKRYVFFVSLFFIVFVITQKFGNFTANFCPKKPQNAAPVVITGNVIETIYGTYTVEPVVVDLINSPVIERIRGVRQYGVCHQALQNQKEYTRFQHCVGVFALLRRYGAGLEEQIAGLLHDASHTVFSHVADHLFDHKSVKNSYQDDIHEWYLGKQNVAQILSKHGITLASVLHKSGEHRMLEQDLPDLCVDRIEYNLQAGLLTGTLDQPDIHEILNHLKYVDGVWFFDDAAVAAKFSKVSLYNSEYVWGGVDNFFIHTFASQALKRAVVLGLITYDDIHFSTDDIVWDKLIASSDAELKQILANLLGDRDCYTLTAPDSADQLIRTKFRGVDPLVNIDEKFVRLTVCDAEYAQEYERVKKQVTDGWPIAYTEKYVKLLAVQAQAHA